MMIYHIYWGATGNNGLYIDEIYRVLESTNIKQEVFVGYYYPFNYGNKIFFKHSDIAHTKYGSRYRSLLKAYDSIYAFVYILIKSLFQRPSLINFSFVGIGFDYLVRYLKLLKWVSGSKLAVTCHDVIPFKSSRIAFEKDVNNHKKIFELADYLIVHNKSSMNDLISKYDMPITKIVYYRLPIHDLLRLYKPETCPKKYDFLFIGHLRKEKGILFLIENWLKFHNSFPNATLCVAGTNLVNLEDKDEYKKANITLKLHFISDEDFPDLVKQARYVVLPYVKGSNSGIASEVLSLGANVITSDLPLFKDDPLIKEDCVFKTNDNHSFLEILKRKYESQEDINPRDRIVQYRKEFTDEVLEAYKILTGNEKY